MRIACIAASKIPSRTANSIQVMKVCQSFLDLGHEVRLWLPGRAPDISWDSLLEHYGIRDPIDFQWVRAIPSLRRYDFCARAVISARGWRSDLYYIWPLQAAAIASSLGLPTALEMHDRPQGRFGPRLFTRFLRGAGARRLLPITEALREHLEKAFNTGLERPFVQVSPMGVDLARYEQQPNSMEARNALGLPQVFMVGYTGHLYPGRGIELLVELARRHPSIGFLWAGGEPRAVERWRQRLVEASVNNVHILGFVPNEQVPLLQAACDVLLMPYERRISVSSGGNTARFASPMKVFEYLASGRAIVASDLPVLREVLNESNAVFAPPENVDAWDEALTNLRADDEKRERLAAQARKDAANYTWTERARRALEGLEVNGAS
jgi:glycosyltransferase involved in cell wall biosynthesis